MHLVDHLRWLRASGLNEESISLEQLRRYMGLCGAQYTGPLGVAWRSEPLSPSSLAGRAAALKGYYLDLTEEGANPSLRKVLATSKLPTRAVNAERFLAHVRKEQGANPLATVTSPKRHKPKMLPEGGAKTLHDQALSARDRMVITWLADGGLRVGEMCGLHLGDLHLRRDHPCREDARPHLHICKRLTNPNDARAKMNAEWKVGRHGIQGGKLRLASPAMIDSYYEYMLEEYPRAAATTELLLVSLAPSHLGRPLPTNQVRRMMSRTATRAGLEPVHPHQFRHTFASAVLEVSGGNTLVARDAGGWSSARTVEEIYGHLSLDDPALQSALQKVWSQH